MKFFLISDNLDSCRGFRLAGIEGVVVSDKEELMENINKCLKDPSIGIILITEKLVSLEYEKIYDLKLKHTKTLIVEVPSPGASFQMTDSITRYIREAIGIKI
ncbi:MAG: V-type ATP synthase subunit F [Oscillospiraceae bacterium]|nr:V-type ATP synthase subunit F [Oscillospiraceae bacterium]